MNHADQLDLLASVTDPAAFAINRFGFHPDPLQAEVLNSDERRVMLCCSRQWGKSTVTAVKAAITAYSNPGVTILVVALVRKCAAFLARIGIKRRSDGHNRGSVALPHGSRIVSLPPPYRRCRRPLLTTGVAMPAPMAPPGGLVGGSLASVRPQSD